MRLDGICLQVSPVALPPSPWAAPELRPPSGAISPRTFPVPGHLEQNDGPRPSQTADGDAGTSPFYAARRPHQFRIFRLRSERNLGPPIPGGVCNPIAPSLISAPWPTPSVFSSPRPPVTGCASRGPPRASCHIHTTVNLTLLDPTSEVRSGPHRPRAFRPRPQLLTQVIHHLRAGPQQTCFTQDTLYCLPGLVLHELA